MYKLTLFLSRDFFFFKVFVQARSFQCPWLFTCADTQQVRFYAQTSIVLSCSPARTCPIWALYPHSAAVLGVAQVWFCGTILTHDYLRSIYPGSPPAISQ